MTTLVIQKLQNSSKRTKYKKRKKSSIKATHNFFYSSHLFLSLSASFLHPFPFANSMIGTKRKCCKWMQYLYLFFTSNRISIQGNNVCSTEEGKWEKWNFNDRKWKGSSKKCSYKEGNRKGRKLVSIQSKFSFFPFSFCQLKDSSSDEWHTFSIFSYSMLNGT